MDKVEFYTYLVRDLRFQLFVMGTSSAGSPIYRPTFVRRDTKLAYSLTDLEDVEAVERVTESAFTYDARACYISSDTAFLFFPKRSGIQPQTGTEPTYDYEPDGSEGQWPERPTMVLTPEEAIDTLTNYCLLHPFQTLN